MTWDQIMSVLEDHVASREWPKGKGSPEWYCKCNNHVPFLSDHLRHIADELMKVQEQNG